MVRELAAWLRPLIVGVYLLLLPLDQHPAGRNTNQSQSHHGPGAPLARLTVDVGGSQISESDASGQHAADDQKLKAGVSPERPAPPQRDWVDKWALGINGALALIGVGGVVIALRTLRKVERQTIATEVAAKAAELSANAAADATKLTMQAERGWVIDEILPLPEQPNTLSKLVIGIRLTNRGRTVSRITEVKVRVQIVDTDGPELRGSPPLYNDEQIFLEIGVNGLVLAPEQSFTFSAPLERDYGRLTQSLRDAIYTLRPKIEKRLLVWGRIVYDDGFTSGRIDQFCYMWEPPGAEFARTDTGFRRVGAVGYNEAT